MNYETTYVADQNDLYEVLYDPADGSVLRVTVYPDNAGMAGEEVVFWRLPQRTRRKILTKIERRRLW